MVSNIEIRDKLTNHHSTNRNVPPICGQFLQRAPGTIVVELFIRLTD
jgi:hypothetical protein